MKTESDKKIHIVGAGPGDVELITVKGRRLLDEAQRRLNQSSKGDGGLAAMAAMAEPHCWS